MRFELRYRDTLHLLRVLLTLLRERAFFSNTDISLANRRRFTDRTLALLIRNLNLRTVDRFRRGAFTDRLDVSRLISNVADVHIDQRQTNLVDFLRNILVDETHKLLAILVDLLDRKRRNHKTELTQNNVLRLFLNRILIQSKQTLRGVIHQDRGLRNTNRKGRRHIHADIVERKRTLQRNLDHQRLKTHIRIVLNHRPHKLTPAVETLRRALRSRTPDHKNAVRWTPSVPTRKEQRHKDRDKQDHRDHDDDKDPAVALISLGKRALREHGLGEKRMTGHVFSFEYLEMIL